MSSEVPIKPKKPSKKAMAEALVQAQAKAELLKQVVSNRQQGADYYAAADRFLEYLIGGMKVGERITHPDTGEVFELIDNFAAKNKAWKPCGITRFDIKAVKGTKPVKPAE
jgi:hypothetical protein